jgi:hypothetical protein
VPGSYVQPSGPPELELCEGRVVTVLPVRVNASSKALTLEVCIYIYIYIERERERSICRCHKHNLYHNQLQNSFI